MKLGEVLRTAPLSSPPAANLEDIEVRGLDYDSRRAGPGCLFFAFAGARHDGRDFAPQAMENGAVAVVSEAEPPGDFSGPWIRVEHGRKALALAARNLYSEISERVRVTGITGTNGKTTTAFLVDSILREAGKTTAMIGTVEYRLADRRVRALNTTPESVDLYRMFSELEQSGGTHATMEVSSHALDLGRVHGVRFHTAVFTNLTRDHLDYHQTMEAYFRAKCLLFEDREAPVPECAVLNRDDEWARRIGPDEATRVIWYGRGEGDGLQARAVQADFSGVRFEVTWQGQAYEIQSPMLGEMNVYNILAAFGAGIAEGIDPDAILRGISACRAVPGRFERVEMGQPFLVVVDYAHTDDALSNAIRAARSLSPKRVLTVFGCGGDRDRTKRPLMGEAAAKHSDYVVLTSDNPRSEDPLAIINDTLVGLRRYNVPHQMEVDRTQAIRIAFGEARPGDIVLIAGKGHETYQTLRDKTIPFDDREVSRRLLAELGYGEER